MRLRLEIGLYPHDKEREAVGRLFLYCFHSWCGNPCCLTESEIVAAQGLTCCYFDSFTP